MKSKSGISKIMMALAIILIITGAVAAYYALTPKTQTITLNGAGATFPEPLIKKWASEYNKINHSIVIDYQGIGSGGGIQQIKEKIVDFAGTDAPVKDEDMTTGY
ncbi:MAG: substrate-binding domain-containing protein, partial [Nitrososphaerales archaeon]